MEVEVWLFLFVILLFIWNPAELIYFVNAIFVSDSDVFPDKEWGIIFAECHM